MTWRKWRIAELVQKYAHPYGECFCFLTAVILLCVYFVIKKKNTYVLYIFI